MPTFAPAPLVLSSAQCAQLEAAAVRLVDAAMLSDAPLLHPPGLIALAALRQARLRRCWHHSSML